LTASDKEKNQVLQCPKRCETRCPGWARRSHRRGEERNLNFGPIQAAMRIRHGRLGCEDQPPIGAQCANVSHAWGSSSHYIRIRRQTKQASLDYPAEGNQPQERDQGVARGRGRPPHILVQIAAFDLSSISVWPRTNSRFLRNSSILCPTIRWMLSKANREVVTRHVHVPLGCGGN
jgi:hypothetical protein